MLIETHAHLDYPDFASDLDDVLRRATEAGVTPSSQSVLQLKAAGALSILPRSIRTFTR
jgi:Mg-dependent DNase